MRNTGRTILQCQKKIHEYTIRREKCRQKYSYLHPSYISLDGQIRYLRQRKRKLISYREVLKFVYNSIEEFIGFPPSPGNHGSNKEKNIARNIFYKYCMEHGIAGSEVSAYIGLKDRDTAARRRRKFTRSFSTNEYNKEIWDRFLLFIRDKEKIK